MLTNVYRVLRLLSLVIGIVASIFEIRDMVRKRQHMWAILRRLVRQVS